MPFRSSSARKASKKPCKANLVAEYPERSGTPNLPATLEIKTLLEAGELDHHNVIGVEIHGQLWAQPVPLEFLVRTDFDLETGKVRITDLISAARVA